MSKSKFTFVCKSCRYSTAKWLGRCPQCNEWNSFEELIENKNHSKHDKRNLTKKSPKNIEEVKKEKNTILRTGIREFDETIGGGITSGSLTLLTGGPGLGKSTLMLEISKGLIKQDPKQKILYITGEETEFQVAKRGKRIGLASNRFYILNETNQENIIEHIKVLQPGIVIIDSIQTIISNEVQSSAGSVAQIREVTYEFMKLCNEQKISMILIGHVLKDGTIAGPKILEHMVDCVLSLEGCSDISQRVLRVIKNRFGCNRKIGIFKMVDEGLKEVTSQDRFIVGISDSNSYGIATSCLSDGNRLFIIEVQSLVVENNTGLGKRITQGLELNRLTMLLAIIEKYLGISMASYDVYVNVIGFTKKRSLESDLAIVGSLLSSYKMKPIKEGSCLLGTISLAGEVSCCEDVDTRINELEMLNYKKIFTSKKMANKYKPKTKIDIVGIEKAEQAVKYIFG